VVVVVGRRRERVDARMLSFVSHPFSLHSFIHSFMVFLLLIIVKRREEKRGERIASLKEEVDIFIVF